VETGQALVKHRSTHRSPIWQMLIGLTQLAGRELHIWRVIGQNTPYMAMGMTQLGPNCVTPSSNPAGQPDPPDAVDCS